METFSFRVTIIIDGGAEGDTAIVSAGTLEEPHYMLFTSAPLSFVTIGDKVMLLLRDMGLLKRTTKTARNRKGPAPEPMPVTPAAVQQPGPVMSTVAAIRAVAKEARKRKTLEPAVGT